MGHMQRNQGKNQGFTLIELSIVLVIIGLIVGGVLVGQDLIKAAEIRATISQLEKLDAATMTFRGKFNGLPGDISNPTTFGFDATGQGAKTGNGLVNRVTDTSQTLLDSEAALYFRHLAQANLIGDPITQGDGTAANVDSVAAALSLSKLGRGNYIAVMDVSGSNRMIIGGMSVTDGTVTFSDAITPTEAYQMDTKMDDGNPLTGVVIAITDFVTADAGDTTPTAGDCVDSTAPGRYMTASTVTANISGCILSRRPSF